MNAFAQNAAQVEQQLHLSLESNFQIVESLTETELRFLSRLPSMKHRKIDILKIAAENDVVVLKDLNGKILLLTFYRNFGDFVYVHTSVGRDEHKGLLYRHLVQITSKIGPTYFIIFHSAESVKVCKSIGAEEISLTETEQDAPNFAERIAELTDRPFYKKGDYLFDHDDAPAVINPIYKSTRASYLASLQAEAESHLQLV